MVDAYTLAYYCKLLANAFVVFCPYYFSVCKCTVIGQFCGPHSIVQPAEFEFIPPRAPKHPQRNKKYSGSSRERTPSQREKGVRN